MWKWYLFPLLFFPLAVYGQTVTLEGKNPDQVALKFQFKGLVLDTPEGAASSFLQMVQDFSQVQRDLQGMVLRNKVKLLEKVATKQYVQNQYAYRSLVSHRKGMEKIKKRKTRVQLEFSKKVLDAHGVTLHYKVTTSWDRTCFRCKGKGKVEMKDRKTEAVAQVPCTSCRTKGKVVRRHLREGKILLIEEGGLWKVSRLWSKCSSCQGKGRCTRYSCRRRPDAKCWSCKGTGTCRSCKGQRWRRDLSWKYLPRQYTNLTAPSAVKVDLSTPEKTYKSVVAVSKCYLTLEHFVQMKLTTGLVKITNFFFPQGYARQRKGAAYHFQKYEMANVEKTSSGQIHLHYKKALSSRSRPQPHLLVLEKTEKKQWHLTGVARVCSRCQGTGKRKGETCRSCQGKGHKISKSLP